jgi:hypothetical protein
VSDYYADRLRDCRRYRLHVASATAADIVVSVGGLILDTMWAGWETTLYVQRADDADERALRVLGGRSGYLNNVVTAKGRVAPPDVLAISSELCVTDRRAWQWARRVIRTGDVSLIVWGDQLRSDLPTMTRVSHQCSAAAVAFKTSALAVLGNSEAAVTPVESFGVKATGRADAMGFWMDPSGARNRGPSTRTM